MTAGDDCAVSECSPPTLSMKALTPAYEGAGESAFGQMSTTLPPQFPATELKQIFLSTKLACLLALRQQAVRPTHTLSVTIWPSLIFPQNLFVKLTFNEATQFFSSLITHSNVLLYIPSESLPFVEYC